MRKPLKSVEEKLNTKLSRLSNDKQFKVTLTKKNLKLEDGRILFKYSKEKIDYTKLRYFPTLKEDIKLEDFSATILLDHQTLNILSGNLCNPPKNVSKVIDMFRHIKSGINKIIIGGTENKIKGKTVSVSYPLYSILTSISSEEGRDKVTRVRNRIAPFLKENYGIEAEQESTDRDLSLLLQEVLVSKQFSQRDIAAITNELESGDLNEIVIEQQINKQAEWLLDSMQAIVDEDDLPKEKAQDLGNKYFHFPKTTISGPEDLMEKILTKYGQNIIFGVPALINIDQYVISANGLPKSQFDILLVNHLSDIEIVELKRPDEYLLEYDASRAKFYMSKPLAIATAQCERYISALYKENDREVLINSITIREFIESKISGTVSLSICRPQALIVIGAIHRLAKPYEKLSATDKAKITKKEYNKNKETAYKEIKASFRNINITTYTELIEGARLRLQAIVE